MRRLIAFFCLATLLAVTVAIPTARADVTYTPTTMTAAQILKAADKAEGKLADGAYKIVEQSHGGGLDATTTTLVSGDNYTSTEVRGPFTGSWGSYNGQDWDQDENGIVTLDADYHQAADPDVRAIGHPADPLSHVTVLGITQGANPAYAVDVHPTGGEHEIRYYDKTTFHLTRVERWGSDGFRHVSTYQDYRTAFGDTRSYHRHYGDGRPDNEFDEKIVSFAKVADAPDFSIPKSRSLFTFPSNDPIVLPTSFADTTSIFVRLTINGRGLDFVLDSGASGIFIDPGVAAQLGLKTYGKNSETIGGNLDISQTIVPLVTIGNLQMKNVVFNVAPSGGEESAGTYTVGLIGYDFLASAIIGVDFKNQTVTAYPPGVSPTHDVVYKVPVQLDDGVPRVSASFEGVSGNFLMDLGAYRTILYPYYVKKLPSATNIQNDEIVEFVGGDVDMSQYVLQDFEFGGIKFPDGKYLVPQDSTADVDGYDGIIGRDALAGYVLYFDYADQAIFDKYEH